MISLHLVPLLLVPAQAAPFWSFENPAWVAGLLRAASPSAPSWHYKAVIRRPGGGYVVPPDMVILDRNKSVTLSPDAPPSAQTVMNRRTVAFMERGDYLEQEAGYDAQELFDPGDLLADVALLSGRHAVAERLLVQRLRLHPGGGSYAVRLSLATAVRDRIYPGQGAYVLSELRETVAPWPEEAGLVAKMKAPTTPAGVLFLSALFLGRRHDEPAYLEWALRLDPRCELAGTRLTDHYGYRGRDADAARVASLMVRSLPAGPARDGFALRLSSIQRRIQNPASATRKTDLRRRGEGPSR